MPSGSGHGWVGCFLRKKLIFSSVTKIRSRTTTWKCWQRCKHHHYHIYVADCWCRRLFQKDQSRKSGRSFEEEISCSDYPRQIVVISRIIHHQPINLTLLIIVVLFNRCHLDNLCPLLPLVGIILIFWCFSFVVVIGFLLFYENSSRKWMMPIATYSRYRCTEQ